MNLSARNKVKDSYKLSLRQIFTFQQVQNACKLLIEEEAHLIVNDTLPERSALIADLFARMAFDDYQFLDSNLISQEQALLIEQYN
jgi:hypothetical protein